MKYLKSYYEDIARVIPAIKDVKKLYGRKVFITGATGLICSGVVDILHYLNVNDQAGIDIIIAARSSERVAKRFSTMKDGVDYTFAMYDATKPVSYDGEIDYIIHGACNASPASYVSEPVEIMEANFIGLNNLLKLATDKKAKRVIYLSSSEVYGQKEGMEPYKEDDYGFLDVLNTRAPYPSSKRASETLLVAYAAEYGIEGVIARPGHIYGPAITDGDSKATAQFTRDAAARRPIVMKSAGTQLRSYTYFLDCASAILAILTSGENLNAYNISNKDSIITISEIAKKIAAAVDMEIAFENPADAEALGYNLMSNSSLDATKLESLGWKAVFSADEGASNTVKYYQA